MTLSSATLLIDAGNTRIKWAVTHGTQWRAHGTFNHDEAAQLNDVVQQHRPQRMFGANVAGEDIAAAIAAAIAPLSPDWLVPTRTLCGVKNSYDEPTQLGADRWAALIGARSLHRGSCIVVSAGTATTIDQLDDGGRFHGGLILPGEFLMRHALARDTACLPLADGEAADLPRNTESAIVTGCLFAQVGAIERMFHRIASEPNALCLLAGGAAARLEPLLTIPCRREDQLVLHGLVHVARNRVP
ncbi:MAG TPA: type III pantothenate kinase [Azoarcus sp.]|nr:type III pantothenate kinase [Azoarcus sp.]